MLHHLKVLNPQHVLHLEEQLTEYLIPNILTKFCNALINSRPDLWNKLNNFFRNILHVLPVSKQKLSAFCIHDVSLLVEYIIICKHMLTRVEMEAFDLFLSRLKRMCDDTILNRLILRNAKPSHHAFHRITRKNTHECIVH